MSFRESSFRRTGAPELQLLYGGLTGGCFAAAVAATVPGQALSALGLMPSAVNTFLFQVRTAGLQCSPLSAPSTSKRAPSLSASIAEACHPGRRCCCHRLLPLHGSRPRPPVFSHLPPPEPLPSRLVGLRRRWYRGRGLAVRRRPCGSQGHLRDGFRGWCARGRVGWLPGALKRRQGRGRIALAEPLPGESDEPPERRPGRGRNSRAGPLPVQRTRTSEN